ncbi:hypothetical protein HPB48_020684 [Haemaphysalis longicornis]|uniref:Acyltransferase n=1 Tax=Haemaphysalis longicornis TaxID=44386 RepID=A0A9J6G3A0_HAELO|nr:hypothetical protein HPB48_020684 [Haemaphysalis longicornis]
MGFLGAKWTPLRLPLHRRLETLAALALSLLLICSGFTCVLLFAYILLCTRYYPLSLGYAAWIYWDRKACDRGGHWNDWVRSWTLWKYLRNYFPIQLVKTCDLPADRNYLFGYHPHGVMAVGAVCNFATDATNFRHLFPGIRTHLATLRFQFCFPFHRELYLAAGVCCASKEWLDWTLGSKPPGKAAVIVLGGNAEMLNAQPGSYKLYLNNRKGFVRFALKYGAPLVPVFSFGENELFVQAKVPVGSWLGRILALFKLVLGYTPPVFYGRGVFQYSWGWVPHRKRIVTWGSPWRFPRSSAPVDEQVDRVHRQYIDALTQLFNDHKDKYAAAGSKLVIE